MWERCVSICQRAVTRREKSSVVGDDQYSRCFHERTSLLAFCAAWNSFRPDRFSTELAYDFFFCASESRSHPGSLETSNSGASDGGAGLLTGFAAAFADALCPATAADAFADTGLLAATGFAAAFAGATAALGAATGFPFASAQRLYRGQAHAQPKLANPPASATAIRRSIPPGTSPSRTGRSCAGG